MSEKVDTQDKLRSFVEDTIDQVVEKKPEAILAALGNNPEAMAKALRELGWSVTESNVDPTVVRTAYNEGLRSGVIQNSFGARLRNNTRSDMVTFADGQRRRSYLLTEQDMTDAESWFRAFYSPDRVDPQSGDSIRQINERMFARCKRAPSNPVTGDSGDSHAVLVPTQIAAEIFELLDELFVLQGMVNVFTSATPLDIPRRTKKVAVYRQGNATDLTEDRAGLGFAHLSPVRVGVHTYIDPLLARAAAVGPVGYAVRQIAEAMAEDRQRVIIAGSEDQREPRGILNLPTADADAFENAQTQAYDDTSRSTERDSMKAGFYSVPQQHRITDQFVWVGNNDALRELTTHNDADQRPWDEASDSYLRKRFIESLVLQTAANETTIVGGDMRQYAWLEHPDGLFLEQTREGGEAWVSHTIGVKGVEYVDGAPVLPNAFVHITSVNV